MVRFGAPDIEKLVAKGDIKGLIKALHHKDNMVREQAARALGRVGSQNAAQALISSLTDTESVRNAAIEALASIGTDAIPSLVATLRGGAPEKSQAAVKALALIGEPAVNVLAGNIMNKNEQIRETVHEALVTIGPASVEALIPSLRSFTEQSVATSILVKIGTPSVNALIKMLNDKERVARESAATALGEIGDSRAAEPLIKCLDDEEHSVRVAAKNALANMDNPRIIDLLVSNMHHDSNRVRDAIINLLRDLGWRPRTVDEEVMNAVALRHWHYCVMIGEPAVQPLIDFLGDISRDPHEYRVRKAVVRALGEIGDERAVEPLLAIIGSGDKYVCRVAAEALVKIGAERAVEPLLKAADAFSSGEYHWTLLWAAEAIRSPEVSRHSGAQFEDDSTEKTSATINPLRGESVDKLIALLNDRDLLVCQHAAEVLGETRDPRAVEPLINVLPYSAYFDGEMRTESDIDREYVLDVHLFRMAAAKALGHIEDVRAVEPLLSMLGDRNDNVCYSAAAALEKFYLSTRTPGELKRKIWERRESLFKAGITLRPADHLA